MEISISASFAPPRLHCPRENSRRLRKFSWKEMPCVPGHFPAFNDAASKLMCQRETHGLAGAGLLKSNWTFGGVSAPSFAVK